MFSYVCVCVLKYICMCFFLILCMRLSVCIVLCSGCTTSFCFGRLKGVKLSGKFLQESPKPTEAVLFLDAEPTPIFRQ